jgi:hypothetical protein
VVYAGGHLDVDSPDPFTCCDVRGVVATMDIEYLLESLV